MKLKRYQSFLESKQDIDSICKKFNITNYTINDDGTIDVEGNVNLSSRGLTKLPLKFRNVSGDFYCSYNKLTTLEGSPSSVGGRFYCSDNKLTTLEGSPSSVRGDFYCYNNKLTTLEGSPRSVGGRFDCSVNKLTTLEGSPRSVGGGFYCYNNQLTTLEGSPQSVGGDFYCSNNQLTTLEGCPSSVRGGFYCSDNKLTTLEGSPRSVGGGFYCYNNQIIDFRGFPEIVDGEVFFVGNPVNDILLQFDKDLWKKAIYWINEYDVIDDKGNVIEDRLEDVKDQLDVGISRFDESVSPSYVRGQDILNDIYEICLPLKDELIEYQILPDITDHIKVMIFGIYLNGGAKRTKFEVNIKLNGMSESKINELVDVIKGLKNLCKYEDINYYFELEYKNSIPKKHGRVGSSTNIVRVEDFDVTMLNRSPITKETPFSKENFCRKITIKFDRIKNDIDY
jgi:hypothetical protein